jgi:biopolymer transport protein ExbB
VIDEVRSLLGALRTGGVLIYPLALLAMLSAIVILEKAFVYAVRARVPAGLLDGVGPDGVAWPALEHALAAVDPRNFVARFCRVIVDNRKRPAWWIESRAADEANAIEQSLGRSLWILETTVTAAPLLGLLGTISGMIRAFRLFGAEGLVDPRGVTGGVAEALIATAVGLFIALVALFAFNWCTTRQALFMDQLERLGTQLVDTLRLDEREGVS